MSKSDPGIISKSPILRPEDVSLDDLHHLSRDSFALWALTSGAKVDNNIVEFDTHRYLLPIYMDLSQEVIWQKAAQLGATSWMLLRKMWWLYTHQGRKGGLYMPNKELVENTSKDRLAPLIESVPPIAEVCNSDDKLGLKHIGSSAFYLFHLGGKSSKDSVPLDSITVDEVRLCKDSDIDQALERISHSSYKMKVFASTAGMPDSDIHLRFQYGTQHCWRSACGCGPDGCDLARTFPDCVVADDPRRPNQVYLRCPKCRWEIKDPQNGRYVPMNPGADANSYHVSQLVSKYISTKEIWTFYQRTRNMPEFFNAKLGLPYVDEANRGVTMQQLEACVNTDHRWASPHTIENQTAMGVDQGADYLYVSIGDNYDGKKRFLHLEIIEKDNPAYYGPNGKQSPYIRLGELMDEYKVRLCVLDAMPNVGEAIQFAQRFPGRVFLAYSGASKEMVTWGDKKKVKEGIRKAGPLLKFKYTVACSHFATTDFALNEWVLGNVIIPHPDALVQQSFDEKTNQLMPVAPARRLFSHLVRLIKNFKESNEETGDGKWRWIHTGGDPHFSDSGKFLMVALERLRRAFVYDFA